MLAQGLLNDEEMLLVKDQVLDFQTWLTTGEARYIVGETALQPRPKKRPGQAVKRKRGGPPKRGAMAKRAARLAELKA